MALSRNELTYLMAYVDGEVEDDEIPEVEALLAKSEEARQLVEQHQAMGDWVRGLGDELGNKKGFGVEHIATHVMSEVEKLGGAKVITLERERAKRELNRQRVKEFGALAAVAAVAAGLYFWPSGGETGASGPVVASLPSVAPAESDTVPPAPSDTEEEPNAPTAVASNGAGGGVDVETVESPAHQFSVFYVPASHTANAQSVVVWIGEE
jgi:anti-sigma factor RsiW